jgi:hypothetical protein
MERRQFLIVAGISGAGGVGLLGCGGSAAPAGTPPTALAAPAVWDPSPLYFIAGFQGNIDLSNTLPPNVLRGGTFALAPSSSPLPREVTLAPDGILSTLSPVESLSPNIFFTYVEPG